MTSPNEDDDRLREAVSKNEARAEWGGVAVVFGLVVEVVLTAAYRHGNSIIEAWGPVSADALIALGVAAEILFARKARSKAETLQHRSDVKIAEANERAAGASLELARLTAPRVLTQEQRGRIVEKLKQFSGTEYDIAISSSDPEILDFVFLVEVALSMAKWIERDWQGPIDATCLVREGMPLGRLGASVTNVMIGVHVNQPPKLWECALAVSDALIAEDIDSMARRLTPHAMSSTNANAIHILIGRKT